MGLCELFGYTKQAYYKACHGQTHRELSEGIMMKILSDYRSDMEHLGGRKLHLLVNRRLPEGMSIGRDAFFKFLRDNGLLQRMSHVPRTTNSYHHYHKYSNLIRDFKSTGANQLWVSDITYIRAGENKFYYLSLITDCYSHLIIGWCLSKNLNTEGCIQALNMALKEHPENTGLIHHSDRGIQYCSKEYVRILKAHHIRISMTENGDPRENAVAERVNGILKKEWINDMHFTSIADAKRQIRRAIYLYNNIRPHFSIDLMTPKEAENSNGTIRRRWRNYYKKDFFEHA